MKTWVVSIGFLTVIAVTGMAQLSGTWEGKIDVLPSLGFSYSTVKITYTISGWELTSTSKFTGTAFDTQSFEAAGTVGGIVVTGKVSFDPTAPAYKDAQVTFVHTVADLSLTVGVHHWFAPYIPSGVCEQTPSSYIEYTLQVSIEPFTAKVTFADCCTGTSFRDLVVTFADVSPCCDISLTGEFAFSKDEGFEHFKITAKNLSLCPNCLVFDLTATFTTAGKEVSIKPKLDLPFEACFTLYADVDFEAEQHLLDGIILQGFAVRCDINDCGYLELKTALSPGTLGFTDGEFQYLKVRVCGSSCCGGEYTGEFTFYFAESGGVLFGISRVHAQTKFPFMEDLFLTLDLDLPIGGNPALELSWSFSF